VIFQFINKFWRLNGKNVLTKNAPAPIEVYSQAIIVGKMVCVSSQIGLSPETGQLQGGDFLT